METDDQMKVPKFILEFMEIRGIEYDDLVKHQKAHEMKSRDNNDRLLASLPQDLRQKIGGFYQALRNKGVYWQPGQRAQEIVSYEEGWKRSKKLRSFREEPGK